MYCGGLIEGFLKTLAMGEREIVLLASVSGWQS